jgi:hypothetical protein
MPLFYTIHYGVFLVARMVRHWRSSWSASLSSIENRIFGHVTLLIVKFNLGKNMTDHVGSNQKRFVVWMLVHAGVLYKLCLLPLLTAWSVGALILSTVLEMVFSNKLSLLFCTPPSYKYPTTLRHNSTRRDQRGFNRDAVYFGERLLYSVISIG